MGNSAQHIKGERRTKLPSKPTGNQIRVKIAANREKRLNIAEAMKTEAGVTAHTINCEDFSGPANFDTGLIYSPKSHNVRRGVFWRIFA